MNPTDPAFYAAYTPDRDPFAQGARRTNRKLNSSKKRAKQAGVNRMSPEAERLFGRIASTAMACAVRESQPRLRGLLPPIEDLNFNP